MDVDGEEEQAKLYEVLNSRVTYLFTATDPIFTEVLDDIRQDRQRPLDMPFG